VLDLAQDVAGEEKIVGVRGGVHAEILEQPHRCRGIRVFLVVVAGNLSASTFSRPAWAISSSRQPKLTTRC
jgi:hypothetical protein